LSDNAFDLFREYLCEILKRFLDSETIVQEAAYTAFSKILITKRETVEPFLLDIFKIVLNVFKKHENENKNKNKNSLLNLFEIFSLLTENFEEAFRNEAISSELIECVFKIWIENVKLYKEQNINNYKNSNKNNENNNISVIFDMIISFVKAASYTISLNLISNFLDSILEILRINYENYEKENKDSNIIDKDLITKCFDLLSNIYISVPGFMLHFENKNLIVLYIYKYLDLNENYLNHYGIALLGDIARSDKLILKDNINFITINLIKNLEIPDMTNKNLKDNNDIEMEKLSICNNSCWTIGILAISYPECLKDSINILMKKLIKIISLPRLNKSLAQNVCICIGRCANVVPDIISNYLDQFLKQFCLSLRNIKDSLEKQEAFM
jgi:transportin-1